MARYIVCTTVAVMAGFLCNELVLHTLGNILWLRIAVGLVGYFGVLMGLLNIWHGYDNP